MRTGQYRLKVAIGSARFLELVDQAAARELLETVANQEDPLPRHDHSVELVKQDLACLAASGKHALRRYGHRGVFGVLAAAPAERAGVLNDEATGLWKLDEEWAERRAIEHSAGNFCAKKGV